MSHLEIERVWVLRGMPSLPGDAEVWHVEQGYMPLDAQDPELPEGRIRRIRTADGRIICRHTTKRGLGLVRHEVERDISEAEFERWWPRTIGRRITKTRYRIRERDLVWEIDRFDGLPLVMAEVELPSESHRCGLPSWLADLVEKEVTFDARYRNAALATDGLPTS